MTSTSASWYRVFGGPVPFEQTDVEVAFLTRVLPLPEFRRVLDVPCGYGRHAAALADLGYAVTGVELDPAVAAEARRRAPGAEIVEGDMRLLPIHTEQDAVICMWASFGFWDDATNADLLAQMAGRLRAGGRLVLDVFDRRFFEPRQGERERDVNGLVVRERHRVRDQRLHSGSSTGTATTAIRSSGGCTSPTSSPRWRPVSALSSSARTGTRRRLRTAPGRATSWSSRARASRRPAASVARRAR